MRYSVRLIDQNLPGLTRELALACWHAADALAPERPARHLYRVLYRAVRGVLRAHIQAYRYCGNTRACDHYLRPTELGTLEWHEPFPPESERVRTFILPEDEPPAKLIGELLRGTVKAVAQEIPRPHWKGLASVLRRQIEKGLHGRIFKSEPCGGTPLCAVNDPYDPWDLRDPKNNLHARLGRSA